jgi:peptide/nickel transport system permease protein
MSTAAAAAPKSQREVQTFYSLVWGRFRKHRLAVVSAIILIFLCFISIFAGVIETILGVSHETAAIDKRYLEPGWPYLFGTNDVGQDVFTRLLMGGRISLAVGIISAVTSAIIGATVGLLAGYFGKWTDSILMRFTDAMLSVPVLPLMIVFSALELDALFGGATSWKNPIVFCLVVAVGVMFLRFMSYSRADGEEAPKLHTMAIDGLIVGGFFFFGYLVIFRFINWESVGSGNFASVIKLIMIIVFFGWMTVARLARAAALQLRNMEFVTAARALGSSDRRILLVHVLPNALAPILVAATLEVGGNILYEAALSFLGLGIQPPVSSWGNMLNGALDYLKEHAMLAFWPGFFIVVTVACFNFFGDGLRDALDPHQVMKGDK